MSDAEKRHTNIYFANGMNSSLAGAQAYQQLLRNIYKATLDTFFPGTYSFPLAYNASIEEILLFRDRAEVYKQLDMMTNNRQEWRREIKHSAEQALKFVKAGGVGEDGWSPKVIDSLKDDANADVLRIITNVSHVIQYLSALREEKRVFVVSHSQGNLFTNTALRSTAQAMHRCEPSLEQIGVGTPAPRAAQFRPFYQTAFDDLIINYVRFWYGSVAPGNVDNDLTGWLPWNWFDESL